MAGLGYIIKEIFMLMVTAFCMLSAIAQTTDPLYGKLIGVLGDSYVHNHLTSGISFRSAYTNCFSSDNQ